MEEIAAGERPSTTQIKHRIAEAKEAEKCAQEGVERSGCGSNSAEQAAATIELIKVLLAWDRIDEFMALLEKADLSRVVQALRDRRDRFVTSAVTEVEQAGIRLEPTPSAPETEVPRLGCP